MKRFVLLSMVALTLITGFSACTKETDAFILGLDDTFPPMGFRDENNEIVGFDIDVAREVCKRLGRELVCQPIDWAAKEQELNTGTIDCIWNGFTITEERLEALTFSEPYLRNAQIVVVRADSEFNTLADLAGKKCGVQAGSSSEDAIESSLEFKTSLEEVVPFKDNLTALIDLETSGVDAVVMDLFVANDNINRSKKNFRILEESLVPEEYGIGFRKGDVELRDQVQAKLSEMKADGTLAQISEKWFGADITIVK